MCRHIERHSGLERHEIPEIPFIPFCWRRVMSLKIKCHFAERSIKTPADRLKVIGDGETQRAPDVLRCPNAPLSRLRNE